MNDVIVVMGLPGTGKSTLGKQVATICGYKYISTGDIARELADKSWQDKGELAPETFIRTRFMEEVSKANSLGYKGLIIDGMPRTIEQVYFISSLFPSIKYINLHASHDVLIYRLSKRGREDDTLGIIKARIEKAEYVSYEIQKAITDFFPCQLRKDQLIPIETNQVDVNTLIKKILEVIK